ncbi:hypothetical protein HUT16_15070 [Kitasatospora sp. NA04385]|uniref:hypothetical protein n=1 Tax=Kitasatospora sp. NA04385 TaxID=2742135 RepID=UPI001592608B|nr:hypothetical protein [Kitasatospora sp. NA04385]QKW20214.1 hypothetical protein HUT16_15070 [Kitasatospora sp. NA04385]
MTSQQSSAAPPGVGLPLPGAAPGDPTARLTIRVYTVRADGSRVQVSSCAFDEDLVLPLVSALTWPACACPRCTPAARDTAA